MLRGLKAFLVLFLVADTVHAEEWKTPDGMIAVTVPDLARFVKVDTEQDALVIWDAQDHTMRMLVSESDAPAKIKPNPGSVEEAFMLEVNKRFKNGKLRSSFVGVQNGYVVFRLTAQGDQNGTPVYLTQTLTVFGGKSYKAMVGGFGKDTRTDPDAIRFIDSFKILAPPPPPEVFPDQPKGAAPAKACKHGDDRLPGILGTVVGLLVFVAVLAWLLSHPRRGKKNWTAGEV
jgi:hypothetical protein